MKTAALPGGCILFSALRTMLHVNRMVSLSACAVKKSDPMQSTFVRVRDWCAANFGRIVLAVIVFAFFVALLWHAQYYSHVFGRSLSTAFGFFGGWRALVLPLATFTLGAVAHWIGLVRWPSLEDFAGRPVNQLSVNAIYGVAGVFMAFVLVWVFAVVDAPVALVAETMADHGVALQDKQHQVEAAFAERNKISEKTSIYTAQIEQLTIENAALQKGAPVLTDPQARIAAIREQFLAHAEKAPTKENFSREVAHEWWIVASQMKQQSVSYNSHLHFMHFNEESGTYQDFLESLGGFRAIAANLTESDLQDNSPAAGD
jgi:hypothetical protein